MVDWLIPRPESTFANGSCLLCAFGRTFRFSFSLLTYTVFSGELLIIIVLFEKSMVPSAMSTVWRESTGLVFQAWKPNSMMRQSLQPNWHQFCSSVMYAHAQFFVFNCSRSLIDFFLVLRFYRLTEWPTSSVEFCSRSLSLIRELLLESKFLSARKAKSPITPTAKLRQHAKSITCINRFKILIKGVHTSSSCSISLSLFHICTILLIA